MMKKKLKKKKRKEEIYKRYRPKKIKDLFGQTLAKKMMTSMMENDQVPHAMLFTGPSGCGKTTCARILSKFLGVSNMDLYEVNCADFRGIDMVRGIRTKMRLAPFRGKHRVWIIDEAHQLSRDAQNAFLKILEDTPRHCFFFLATTDPQKLLPTIRTRSTEIVLKSLPDKDLRKLLDEVIECEDKEIDKEVLEKIIENANGSARQALVTLQQIINLHPDDQLDAVANARSETDAIELFKSLMYKSSWKECAKILSDLEEDPEGLRRLVIACARNNLLKGGKAASQAYIIIDSFRDNFYDSGKAGLAAACWEVFSGK